MTLIYMKKIIYVLLNEIICKNDYCQNNGICSINGNNLKCTCQGNYTGLLCEITLNSNIINETINNLMDTIKQKVNNIITNYTTLINDDNLINTVKQISNLFKDSKKLDSNNNIENNLLNSNQENLELIKNLVIKTQEEEVNDNYNNFKENLIHFTSLTIYYQTNLLFNLKGIRRLNDEETIENEELILKNILLNTYKEYSQLIKKGDEIFNYISNSYYETITSDNMIDVIILPNLKSYYYKYVNNCKNENIPYITLLNNELVDNNYNLIYLQVSFHYNTLKSLNYDSPSQYIMLGKFSINSNEISENNFYNNYIINLPINNEKDSKFNLYLFKYFSVKGINIYNKNDESFNEKCYRNKKIKVDYSPKYRKKNLYQNYTITGINEYCIYLEYDKNNEYIQLLCSNNYAGYYLKKDEFTKNEMNNKIKILKCDNKISDYKNNIGFILYMIIIILFLIYEIVSIITFKNENIIIEKGKYIDEGLEKASEKSINKNDESIDIKKLKENTYENNNSNNNIMNGVKKYNKKQKTLSEILINNLFLLHPLLQLVNILTLNNKIINYGILFVTITNLFGFNSLYYTEKMFERRIIKKHRNYFFYPMKYEFGKIISSIASSILINIIIRLITFGNSKNNNDNTNNYEIEKKNENNNLLKIIQIIIGLIIIIFFIIFFTYYCTIFCYYYYNTQLSWFYSGIWSLIWDWIIFGNLYIFIISIIEKSGNENGSNILKQFYIF